LAAADLTGRRVVVRGDLASGTRGLVTLREPTCGDLSNQQLLRVRDSNGDGLFLLPAQPSDAFLCLGDASLLCCGFSPEGRVLVSGTLAKRPVPRGDYSDHVLEDPKLCRLDTADAGQ